MDISIHGAYFYKNCYLLKSITCTRAVLVKKPNSMALSTNSNLCIGTCIQVSSYYADELHMVREFAQLNSVSVYISIESEVLFNTLLSTSFTLEKFSKEQFLKFERTDLFKLS